MTIKSILPVAALLACLIYLPAIAYTESIGPAEAKMNAIAADLVTRIDKGNFLEAAKLFHFPPAYTPDERSKDAVAVASTLETLTAEFGAPNGPMADDSPALWYSIGGGGGDLEYWQKYPYSVDLRLRVTFSREGPGWVIIKFSNVEGAMEIRKVDYCLPADRADALDRIKQVAEKLMRQKGMEPPHSPDMRTQKI